MDHIPVVCIDGLIMNDRKEFLLVERKNEPLKGEFWLPGGRLLRGESLDDGIRRKMKEELGTEVEIVKLLGHFEEFFEKTEQGNVNGFHCISFVFQLTVDSDRIRLDEQSENWEWFRDPPPKLVPYKLLEKIV